MKLKYLLLGAAALSIATGAQAQIVNSPFADQTINGGIHTNNDNSTNNAGGAVIGSGNSAANGGSATATTGPTIVAPNISPTIRTDVDTSDVNVNGQDQRQIQGQQANNSQSQTTSSAVTNAGNSANTNTTSSRTDNANNAAQSTNVTVQGDHNPRQVASAQAPVIVNVASCAMGFGVGAQGPGAGLSIGGARIDKSCDRRATAQILFQLGEKETALQYLASGDPQVSEALTLVRSRK